MTDRLKREVEAMRESVVVDLRGLFPKREGRGRVEESL